MMSNDIPTGYVPRPERIHPGPITMSETPEQVAQADRTRGKAIDDMTKCSVGTQQPAPTPNAQPPVWPLVMVDMAARDNLGRKRYGTALQPFNGRDNLRDAYEEALDLAVYLRTAIYERDGK